MAGETIEKLVIKIQADIDKAQRDLDSVQRSIKDTGSEAEKAGDKVQRSGKKMEAAFNAIKVYAAAAAAALAAIGIKSIQIAGDAAEIENKFEAVFKNTSESARRWAEDFSDTVGRSTLETLQYLSTFQDTFVPLGFDRTEAALLSEQLTELSVDLASFNNMADTETITALQSALVGNHETMRRYGVIITQTTLDQELMNMGIEKGIQGATEQEKVMARLNIIMNSTEDAQGDAARTADEYANQMRALKGNISDVMAEAGQPAMEDLTQTMIDFNEWGTSGGYDRMAEGIGDVASAFAKVAEFGASTVQVLTDLYAVVDTQTLEVPEGMKMTDSQPFSDSFTIGVVPDFDLLDLTDSQLEQIKQTLEETATVQEEITGEYKKQTQELAKQNSEIPDWAGRSDYIRGRMAETGTTTLNDMMSLGSSTPETHDNVVTSTRSIEQSAGGSISTSLLDVSRSGFNTVSQKLDRVVDAVNNIRINVSTGSRRSGTSSSDVLANMKENLIKPPIDPRI
jgi:uncharacterized membrane-anchored protein YhcB (DUF1043 family)